jgi:serine phosphatase RsbU (regulator of sigma subunit)
MLNEESIKAGAQKELQFEFDKKTTADSLRVIGEKKVMNAQLAQEKTQRFALYGGLAIVIVFAGFMYNRFKVTSSQKRIIEAKEKETHKQYEIITHQKHLVDEKQKEILDSINYASRIQKALLPNEKYIEKNLRKFL